ncbi:uncharacterized protein LOC113388245 [Ctenocephalides felis]|uniref:uncharacterized protein LOC113388245 n=1 Tax=Ctenocephalides felis TaxID=7515 RepID=UPI000E6E3058|nr:uncharacterized protein LOC113388245 [Ctenocephalides felis]
MRHNRNDATKYQKELQINAESQKLNAQNSLTNEAIDVDEFMSRIVNFNSGWICSTCGLHAYRGEIYKLATSNGLKFEKVPEYLEQLTDLEERMVSPVINFMQIRSLKPYALNPQLGLKGSVVNIPIEVNECLKVLPRKFSEMKTIQVKLKRHLDHKSDYMFESVRPKFICNAIKYLINTPLYKKYEITFNEKYFDNCENLMNEEVNFIVDKSDAVNDAVSFSNQENINENCNLVPNINVDAQAVFDLDQINNDETMLIDNNDITAKGQAEMVKVIAPGQNKLPLPWHKIEDVDELCFPKIFAGHTFSPNVKLSYKDRTKSEIRRHDRRSCVPTRILFMAKEVYGNFVLSKSEHMSEAQKSLIEFDDGYRLLKNLRSSPAFWQDKKKKLLAMIRQLGRPTLFLTLSAAESHWPELLKTLMKYSNFDRSISTRDAYLLDQNIKTNLIRNDPVSCARYFDFKVNKLMWLLRQEDTTWESSRAYSSMATECTQYQADSNQNNNFIDFIDKFLTCKYDPEDPYVKLQMHRHGHTCYKGQKAKTCRFKIPHPVMRSTMILEPLQEGEISKRPYKEIDKLMNTFYAERKFVSFDDVLQELDMSEAEYLLAIRSTLKQSRLFLKRSSMEVGINSYNRDILHLFESNIDLQFIIDEYGAISYVTNYISKIEGGLSKLLREAAADCNNNNVSVKDKFRKITNLFLNHNLMSAQEAAYHVLSLSLSKQSRKTIFINTSPSKERVHMLKSSNCLEKLNEDSTEIFMADIFDRYTKRPKHLEYICLADFAANYEVRKLHKAFDEDKGSEEQNEDNARRGKSAIIRYVRYRADQDAANYYREKLLLFKPWRNEQTEVENVDFQTQYNRFKNIIEDNQAKFSIISDDCIDQIMQLVDNELYANPDNDDAADMPEGFDVDIFQQGGVKNDGVSKTKTPVIKSRYTCPTRISQEELYKLMICLNAKQKEFVLHILHCYKLGKLPFQIFLSGSAGVGKSTVIEAIYQLITNYFDGLPGGDMDKIVVLLCAPSGKAAFLINVQLSSDLVNTVREKLSKVQLVIIDEISMVGSATLSRIDTRLRQIKGVNEPFGGVSILAVGDLNQLPPVKDRPVYQVSRHNEMEAFFDVNPLWNEFHFYELTEVMRQRDDLLFINALNNLANDALTNEDLALIKEREVKPDDVPEYAIRLYGTNKNVSMYNEMKIESNTNVLIVSEAENSFSNNSAEHLKQSMNKLLRTRAGDDFRLENKINFKISIKYMINYNIDIEDGLVNGACGILRLVTFNGQTNKPEIVWLDFQMQRVGKKARLCHYEYMIEHQINTNWTPIKRMAIKTNASDDEKYHVIRNQFPLVPAEAMTIHKAQGQTYDAICLDFTKKERRDKSMLYVALSRVKKLSGLYILGSFDIQPSTSANDVTMKRSLVEINRLRATKTLNLSYNTLKDVTSPVLIYQNVGTLKKQMSHINADRWFRRGDIVTLSETLTKASDKVDIDDTTFSVVYRSNYNRNGRGLLCYAKKNMKITKVIAEADSDNRGSIELVLFVLPSDAITTNSNTQIDIIFSNYDNIQGGVYETYFSYHKPIYAIIDEKQYTTTEESRPYTCSAVSCVINNDYETIQADQPALIDTEHENVIDLHAKVAELLLDLSTLAASILVKLILLLWQIP